MTDYTKKSFSVAVGSDAYRENWDRIFAKKQDVSEKTDDTKSAATRGYHRLIEEGMSVELATRIRDLRAYADRKWGEGRKESSTAAHDEATRLTEEWRESRRVYPWGRP